MSFPAGKKYNINDTTLFLIYCSSSAGVLYPVVLLPSAEHILSSEKTSDAIE